MIVGFLHGRLIWGISRSWRRPRVHLAHHVERKRRDPRHLGVLQWDPVRNESRNIDGYLPRGQDQRNGRLKKYYQGLTELPSIVRNCVETTFTKYWNIYWAFEVWHIPSTRSQPNNDRMFTLATVSSNGFDVNPSLSLISLPCFALIGWYSSSAMKKK